MQHPETAIGVNPAHPLGSQHLDSPLDPPGDQVGRLDNGVLDVNHTDPQCNFRFHLLKERQLVLVAPGEREHQVITGQRVEEGQQCRVAPLLDRLSAVIPEAEVNGRLALGRRQHTVDTLRGKLGILGTSRKVRLVDL